MRFEWDEEKRESNLAKHGIDFEDAKRLFETSYVLLKARKTATEERFLIAGVLEERIIAVVWTWRAKICRLISARTAHPKERGQYYERINAGESSPPIS